MKKAVLSLAAAAALGAPMVLAQTPATAVPKFEVASVKRCTGEEMAGARGTGGGRGAGGAGGNGPGVFNDPGMFRTGCVPVNFLIAMAYIRYADGSGVPVAPLKDNPIEGGPAWIDSDRYSIDAKPESPQTRAVMGGPMLRVLLEDRFQLKLHRESKEVAVYALVAAKGGTRLQPTKDGGCTASSAGGAPPPVVPGQPLPCGYIDGGAEGVDAVGVPVTALCRLAGSQVGRKVIDRTGLSGLFNFHVDFNVGPPRSAPAEDDPAFGDRLAMVTAALQKLGLKLVPAKGKAEFLVIDRVERPTAN